MTGSPWRTQLDQLLHGLEGAHTLGLNERVPSTIVLLVLAGATSATLFEVVFDDARWQVESAWQLGLMCACVLCIISVWLYERYTRVYHFEQERIVCHSMLPWLRWQLAYLVITGYAVEWNHHTITAIILGYPRYRSRRIRCTHSMQQALAPIQDAYHP